MKNTFGNNLTVTLFGESHGKAVGCVIDGISPGIIVDESFIAAQMKKRKGADSLSTKRREADEVNILSGVFEGRTTGSPICIVVKNLAAESKDYSAIKDIARPGHADYSAQCKYGGFQDYRGGGHFSGRITAPLVAAGAIAISALKSKGIRIGAHISKCAHISDRAFDNYEADFDYLENADFPMLSDCAAKQTVELIEKTALDGDSVGGILTTAVIGIPSGVGEPWFDSVESMLSHALFSIPGIKGVEFGDGFDFAEMKGSDANDAFCMSDGKIITETNRNGGINGGITNGMPIVFSCAVKPTPSVFKRQNTVNFKKKENTVLQIEGRHDPAIIHRVKSVAESVTAIVLCDFLIGRYGTDYFKGA